MSEKIQRIPEQDLLFKRTQEENNTHLNTESYSQPIGKDYVDTMRGIDSLPSIVKERISVMQQAQFKEAKGQLMDLVSGGSLESIVESHFYLKTVLDQPGVLETFMKSGVLPYVPDYEPDMFTSAELDEELYDVELSQALIDEKVSDELIALIIRTYVEHFERCQERFVKELPGLKNRFLKRCSSLIENGTIPLSTEQLQERLEGFTCRVADRIVMTFQEASGHFLPDLSMIELDAALLETDTASLEAVFTHEVLHAISGRISLKETFDDEFATEGVNDDVYKTQHIGLLFGTERFRWLNEAITEDVAWKLLKVDELFHEERDRLGSYKIEQDLYHAIRTRGKQEIPEGMFFAAYFERNDEDRPAAKWRNATRDLIKTVNQAYEPGFMVKVDKFIVGSKNKKERVKRIKKVISLLEEGKPLSSIL